MNDKFRRILDLVRRTGDTMVVTDPNGDDVFVVMDIDQYEMLLDVGFKDEEPKETTEEQKDIWGAMKPAGEDGETWDLSQMDEGELKNLEEQYRQFASKKVSEAIEEKQEEKQQENEDDGEEQFYLEPIE